MLCNVVYWFAGQVSVGVGSIHGPCCFSVVLHANAIVFCFERVDQLSLALLE